MSKHQDNRFLPYTLEKRHQGRYLLVLGLARSGTSFLSSLLGGHPEINMLSESYDSAITRSIGSKYAGNKLCAHQIRYDSFSPVPERLVANGRPKTVSKLLFTDYVDLGAKIIIIMRDTMDVRRSMITRAGATPALADRVIADGLKFLAHVNTYHKTIVVPYESLCEFKEVTLGWVCEYLEIEYSDKMLDGEKWNWVYSGERDNV